MDLNEFVRMVIENGVTLVLLLGFVRYFFDRDKKRDSQIEKYQEESLKRESLWVEENIKREEHYKSRENILLAESARREELLKTETEKREKILRQESEKREAALLNTIASQSDTLKEISVTLNDIKNGMFKLETKIGRIENNMFSGGGYNDRKT